MGCSLSDVVLYYPEELFVVHIVASIGICKNLREPKGTKEIDAKDKKLRLFKQNEKREGNHFLFTKVKSMNGRRIMRSPYLMAI